MATRDLETEDIALLASVAVSTVTLFADEIYASTAFKLLKIISSLVSLVLAVRRMRTAKPFHRDITEAEWVKNGNMFEFTLSKRDHERGKSPQVRCLAPNGHGGWSGCFVDPDVRPDGSITVRVDTPVGVIRLEVRKRS